MAGSDIIIVLKKEAQTDKRSLVAQRATEHKMTVEDKRVGE